MPNIAEYLMKEKQEFVHRFGIDKQTSLKTNEKTFIYKNINVNWLKD